MNRQSPIQSGPDAARLVTDAIKWILQVSGRDDWAPVIIFDGRVVGPEQVRRLRDRGKAI